MQPTTCLSLMPMPLLDFCICLLLAQACTFEETSCSQAQAAQSWACFNSDGSRSSKASWWQQRLRPVSQSAAPARPASSHAPVISTGTVQAG